MGLSGSGNASVPKVWIRKSWKFLEGAQARLALSQGLTMRKDNKQEMDTIPIFGRDPCDLTLNRKLETEP